MQLRRLELDFSFPSGMVSLQNFDFEKVTEVYFIPLQNGIVLEPLLVLKGHVFVFKKGHVFVFKKGHVFVFQKGHVFVFKKGKDDFGVLNSFFGVFSSCASLSIIGLDSQLEYIFLFLETIV
jgi:hypothetical protein